LYVCLCTSSELGQCTFAVLYSMCIPLEAHLLRVPLCISDNSEHV